MTDADLVAAFRAGKSDAFERLLSRHKSSLYSFVLSMVKDEAAASDIFQETFIRVFRDLDKYSEEGKFRGWLYRTALNLAMDHFRRSSAARRFEASEPADCDGQPQDPLETVEAAGEEPSEMIMRRADKAALDAALAQLPPEQREVVFLREYSGLSFKEIAAITGAPLGTVLARMSRAVKKLRTALEKNYERA